MCSSDLGYWDIFKNYYANKQEEKAYFIGSNDPLSVNIDNSKIENPNNISQQIGTVNEDSTITINDPQKIYNEQNLTFWVTQTLGHSPVQMTVNEIGVGSWAENKYTIKNLRIPTGQTWWIRLIQSTAQQALETFNLEEIDKIRDLILKTAGNVTFEIGNVE